MDDTALEDVGKIVVIVSSVVILLLLTACGPIPVQVSKQSQDQRQEQSVTTGQQQSADQKSDHQSESRQGTNSMPVIIICNSTHSPYAHCAAPAKGGALADTINDQLKGTAK